MDVETTCSPVSSSVRARPPNLTSGSIHRAIWFLAPLMVLETCILNVSDLFDANWVSRLGSAALAAVTLGNAVRWFVNSLSMGLGVGGMAVVARRVGAHDREAAGLRRRTDDPAGADGLAFACCCRPRSGAPAPAVDELLQGGRVVRRRVDVEQIPVFVRAGGIIPRLDPSPDTLLAGARAGVRSAGDDLRVDLYPGADGRLRLADGTEFAWDEAAQKLTIAGSPVERQVSVRRVGVEPEVQRVTVAGPVAAVEWRS